MSTDLAQFHEVFFEETREALDAMESALLALTPQSCDPELINALFRSAHSIKGGAGMFSFAELVSITHSLETFLDKLRSGESSLTDDICSTLLNSVDVLRSLVNSTQHGTPIDRSTLTSLEADLAKLLSGEPKPDGGDPKRRTEEPASPPDQKHATSLPPPATQDARVSNSAAGSDSSSIRVGVTKIDELINKVGEIVITQSMLAELGPKMHGASTDQLTAGLTLLERKVRELHERVMRVRMVPIGFAFNRFPRLVHDLASKLGKKLTLKITGEQTELDKTVLERISDPLVHLVRNSLDHGLESPEERISAGKSPTGQLHLNAFHRGSAIVVEISDDGRGLNRDKIIAKACSQGLLESADTLSDNEVYELIFRPGFSTLDHATELSGRGVGMDVVRRNIMSLGGRLALESTPGRGCRFEITLPLTLAIVDGQSVVVRSETYIVPLASIVETLPLKSTKVVRLPGSGDTLVFRGDYLPLIHLDTLFGLNGVTSSSDTPLVVVVEGDGCRAALLVDELHSQQQVVIKPLDSAYGNIPGVSGATILGDGKVALILDVAAITRPPRETQSNRIPMLARRCIDKENCAV